MKVPWKVFPFQTIHLVFILVLYTLRNQLRREHMRKQLVALFSAMLITGLVAMSMVVIGVNAMTNQNGTVVSNSPVPTAVAGSSTSTSDQAQQIAQLQAQVAQYQAREQQYQAALNSDNQQLSQATSEIQTVQQLIEYLQSRGVISIDSQGQIFVNGR
jgi:uncharacterized protein YlxW (UPF0749 family)